MNEFETLRVEIAEKRIQLGVHIRKMNTPGSPVYRYSENIVWPFALVAVAIIGMLAVNIHVGMALMMAGIVWWLWKEHPKTKEAVFQRSAVLALSDERIFDGLWAKGALTLYVETSDGERMAATRKNDWRAFVRKVVESQGGPAEATPAS